MASRHPALAISRQAGSGARRTSPGWARTTRPRRTRSPDPSPPTTCRTASGRTGSARTRASRRPTAPSLVTVRTASSPVTRVPQMSWLHRERRTARRPTRPTATGRADSARLVPPGWLPARPVCPGPVHPGPVHPGPLRPGRVRPAGLRAARLRPAGLRAAGRSGLRRRRRRRPRPRAAVAFWPAAFWPGGTAASRRGADGPVPGRGRRRRGRDRDRRRPADQERGEQGSHWLVHAEHRQHRGAPARTRPAATSSPRQPRSAPASR